MDDVMLTKLSDVQLASFVDELEKIAAEGGLSGVELLFLKEAFGLSNIRQGITSGLTRIGAGMERSGLAGGAKLLHAATQPIETGGAGRALTAAGQHFTNTAGPGVLGGAGAGLGQVLQHHGKSLEGGGAGAVMRAGWKVMNPVGTLAEAGAASGGHMVSRAAGLNPQGFAHKALTHYGPKAMEMGGAAGMAAVAGVPMGVAGALGHGAMGALGHAAPAVAELASHAVGPLGEAGGELAHHVGADVLGTHGHGIAHNIYQKFRGAMPGAARAAQAAPVSV